MNKEPTIKDKLIKDIYEYRNGIKPSNKNTKKNYGKKLNISNSRG